MKKIFLAVCLVLTAYVGFAQNGIGMPLTVGRGGVATTFNEYDEAIGINPANLGYSKLGFSVAAGNFGALVSSDELSLKDLSRIFLDKKKQLSDSEKATLQSLFTTDNGLNFQSHTRYAAASVMIPKLGSFAASLEGYSTAHIGLNENAADIMFNGQNAEIFKNGSPQNQTASDILNGTRITYSQFRTLNVAYGRKIASFGGVSEIKLVDLYGGVGYKYIWGMGHLDINAENDDFTGLSSFSNNKDIDYGNLQNFDPQKPENLFSASGTGYALDFGLNAEIAGMIKVGVAVINLGKVTWSDNVLTATDTNLRVPSNNDGAENFDFKAQAEMFYGENAIFNFSPSGSFETTLPTLLRLGVGIKPIPMLEIGADYVVPLNEANPTIDKGAIAFAAQVNAGLVKISSGFSYNQQYGGGALPLGLQINLGFTRIGIATGDILSLVNGTDAPNASLAVGLFRFNL